MRPVGNVENVENVENAENVEKIYITLQNPTRPHRTAVNKPLTVSPTVHSIFRWISNLGPISTPFNQSFCSGDTPPHDSKPRDAAAALAQ